VGTDAQASFAINLQDGTSGAAEAAAGSLQRLRTAIEGDQRELRALQQAMKNLQGGASVNIGQFRQLKAQIDAKKQAIAGAQGQYLSLGGTFTRTGAAARGTSSRFAELLAQARGAPGPLGAMTGRFAALGGVLGAGLIAAGIVAIVAAMVALVAAAGAAVVALARYGIAQANARRAELLRLEGLTKLRNYYGIAAGNAGELQQAIDRVSGSVALGRDKVGGYAEQLYRMGLRGDNLAAALEGVAIKAAVQGDAHAKAFAGWAAGANLTGRSVRALADDVKARLGGIAAAQMLDLNVQAEKLRENLGGLFAGLKIEAFAKGVGKITELFSQSTATGRALKGMLERLLQPLINSAAGGAPLIKRFFQGMVIGALQLENAFLRLRLWAKRTFGASDVLKGIDGTTLAIKAGQIAVGAFAVGLVLAAAAITMIAITGAAIAASIAAPFVLAAVAGRKFYSVLGDIGTKLGMWLQSTDFATLGVAIIDGIVGGLQKGGKVVVDAVTALGSSAISAFRKALGIASPSKAFAELGATLPKGVEVGVQRQAPAARKAVAAMVRPPALPALTAPTALRRGAALDMSPPDAAAGSPRLRAEPAAAGAGGGRSVQITTGDIHVHASSDKPREMALDIKRELERVLEGVALELGALLPEPS
jgi:hypothetical protein